ERPQLPVSWSFRYSRYCTKMFWPCLYPKEASIASIALSDRRWWVRSIRACFGLPGIHFGMKKLSVSAAQRVSTKNPKRRSRNLTSTSSSCSPSWTATSQLPICLLLLSGLRVNVQQELLHIRNVVRGRLAVRVVLGRPALDVSGVVLEPVHRLRGRDHRYVGEHVPADLLDDVDLGRVVRGRVLVEQLVHVGVGVPHVVAGRVVADLGRGLRVQHLAQLVVRRRATRRLAAVREVVVALVELVVVGLLGQVLDVDLDADRRQVLLDDRERGVPVGVPLDRDDVQLQRL